MCRLFSPFGILSKAMNGPLNGLKTLRWESHLMHNSYTYNFFNPIKQWFLKHMLMLKMVPSGFRIITGGNSWAQCDYTIVLRATKGWTSTHSESVGRGTGKRIYRKSPLKFCVSNEIFRTVHNWIVKRIHNWKYGMLVLSSFNCMCQWAMKRWTATEFDKVNIHRRSEIH